jgi:hypothetical protein
MNLPWINKCINEYHGCEKDQETFVKHMAQQELAVLKQNLKGIEFVTALRAYESFCPVCDGYERHEENCWLGKIISEGGWGEG